MKRILFVNTLYIISILYFNCSSSYQPEPKQVKSQPDTMYEKIKNIKPATEEQMKHEYIRDFEAINKDKIFDNTIKWIALNFKSAKQVIDYQDKSAGSIIAKGYIPDVNIYNMITDIYFTLSIDIKDNKARFIFTNITPIDKKNNENKRLTGKDILHIKATEEFDIIVNSISDDVIKKDDF